MYNNYLRNICTKIFRNNRCLVTFVISGIFGIAESWTQDRQEPLVGAVLKFSRAQILITKPRGNAKIRHC